MPGVFAAGDIAEYESVVHGRRLRVEHWDVAFNQGKAAALNMLGRDQPYDVVPYFFSDLSDWASLEYVGPASEWDREVVRGAIDEGEFSIWYLNEGRVVAALSVGRCDDLEHARRLIALRRGPGRSRERARRSVDGSGGPVRIGHPSDCMGAEDAKQIDCGAGIRTPITNSRGWRLSIRRPRK